MLKSVCISLLQPASGRLFLPWWWCCCCFDAGVQLILSLNALITAPDGGISLHLHMLTLMLTCYLSLIVVFHRDVFGTKTSKSPGWCTLRHALRVYTHTHTLTSKYCPYHPPSAVGTPPSLSLVPLMFYCYHTHNPIGPFLVPYWGPAHYYTRRYLSISPAACWISYRPSVVCEALGK